MATPRKEEHEKKHVVEVARVVEYRTWKEARLQEMERGTLQQQRLAALDRSRPWDFTPEEEVEFMLVPDNKTFEHFNISDEISIDNGLVRHNIGLGA